MMHCFIWTTFAALLALASAANVPRLRSDDDLPTRTELRVDSQQRRYQEQDTARAFYSYGYSDDTAARAEYSARDGSSRGFYSYVDADGKLQTVRYEASRGQGFKAEGSNLPQAPIDEGKAPLPVADTEEVQQARSAHLNALREAREEALAASLREESERRQQETGSRIRANANESEERNLSAEDAVILERVRAQLAAMLADRQRSNNLPKINEDLEEQQQRQEQRQEQRLEQRQEQRQDQRQDQRQEQRQEQRQDQRQEQRQVEQDEGQEDQLTAEEDPRNGDRDDQSRLRTVYSLGDLTSSSYLKLGDLQDRLNGGDLRVPVGAYYTLLSPSAKYSVTTPTELRTLRPVALSRSLLVSKRN